MTLSRAGCLPIQVRSLIAKLKLNIMHTERNEFYISYVKDGKIATDRIKAIDWAAAKEIAEQRGAFLKCEYIHTNTDLLYLH